jgi:hypothetical protein
VGEFFKKFLRNEKGGWRAFFSEKGAVRDFRLYIITMSRDARKAPNSTNTSRKSANPAEKCNLFPYLEYLL